MKVKKGSPVRWGPALSVETAKKKKKKKNSFMPANMVSGASSRRGLAMTVGDEWMSQGGN